MKKIIFALACFCSFLAVTTFTSCKKDEPIDVAKEALQTYEWRITGQTLNGNDNFNKLPACNQDDILIFQEDSNVFVDQSIVKCTNTPDQKTNTGTWLLTDDGKKVTTTDLKKVQTAYTITELSKTTLKLEISQVIGTINTTLTTTYTRVK
jgi:hypothetical protein